MFNTIVFLVTLMLFFTQGKKKVFICGEYSYLNSTYLQLYTICTKSYFGKNLVFASSIEKFTI